MRTINKWHTKSKFGSLIFVWLLFTLTHQKVFIFYFFIMSSKNERHKSWGVNMPPPFISSNKGKTCTVNLYKQQLLKKLRTLTCLANQWKTLLSTIFPQLHLQLFTWEEPHFWVTDGCCVWYFFFILFLCLLATLHFCTRLVNYISDNMQHDIFHAYSTEKNEKRLHIRSSQNFNKIE